MPFFLFTFLKFCALLNILLKRLQNKSRIRRANAAFKKNFEIIQLLLQIPLQFRYRYQNR